MRQRWSNINSVLRFILIIAVAALLISLLWQPVILLITRGVSTPQRVAPTQSPQVIDTDLDKRVSYGDKPLSDSPQPEQNNPEALIGQNNTESRKDGRKTLKIAVSAPITGSSKNSNISSIGQEILRGVAQAQKELVSEGQWIKGKFGLEILMANDSNDKGIAQKLAQELFTEPSSEILAVVGHNASDVSRAAAKEYQDKGLVMISPTSFDDQLFDEYSRNYGGRSYIFRAVPDARFMADALIPFIEAQLNQSGQQLRIMD